MELLVVMGIFSLTVMITSGIFMLSNRAQRRVLAITAAQADLRFALEAMVREVRSGRIAYETYAGSGGISIPAPKLILLNAAGQKEEFYLDNDPAVCPAAVVSCLAVKIDGSLPQAVTSIGITIDQLSFFITPQVDPFAVDPVSGLYGSDIQPTVTIAMRARTTNVGASDIQTITAQTTVTSRAYVR